MRGPRNRKNSKKAVIETDREDAGIVYRDGLVRVKILSEEEAAEYKKLKPGITVAADMIRQVAIEDGHIHVLEQTGDGFSRIKVKL